MAGVSVLIVSPSPLARGGLETLIQPMEGIAVVGSGAVTDAASLADQFQPDVVVFDAGAGDADDLAPLPALASAHPGLPILVLAMETADQAAVLSQGAAALLSPSLPSEVLRAAIMAAAYGLVTVARADLSGLVVETRSPVAAASMVEALTRRELEVLHLLAQGMTNRRMADQLSVSEHTIKFHVAALLAKLSARTRAEAVARAIALGVLPI